jgi:hypothetical protein
MTLSQAKPVDVNSSLLANVSYDAGQSVLQLELCDGAIYRYFDVPPVIYEGLLAANSKGSYFNARFEIVSATPLSGGPNETTCPQGDTERPNQN